MLILRRDAHKMRAQFFSFCPAALAAAAEDLFIRLHGSLFTCCSPIIAERAGAISR
jgi:hypothetical protein